MVRKSLHLLERATDAIETSELLRVHRTTFWLFAAGVHHDTPPKEPSLAPLPSITSRTYRLAT